MPSDNWIAAAKATPRQPAAILAIESTDAITHAITTRADWEAGTRNNINTTAVPGTIWLATDTGDARSGTYPGGVVGEDKDSPNYTNTDILNEKTYSANLGTVASASYTNCVGGAVRVRIYRAPLSQAWGRMVVSPTFAVYGRCDGGSWQDLTGVIGNLYDRFTPSPTTVGKGATAYGGSWDHLADPYGNTRNWWFSDFRINLHPLPKGTWEFKAILIQIRLFETLSRMGAQWSPPLPADFYERCNIRLEAVTPTRLSAYLSSGTCTPAVVDMGSTPTLPSRLLIDDRAPVGCSVTATAEGSANGSSWTSLGAVSDGGLLPPYRYYRVTLTLTANQAGTETPEVREIKIAGGSVQSEYFATHLGIVPGARPYLLPDINALTSKIELDSMPTGGELSLKLHYVPEVAELIAKGGLRNRTMALKVGYAGLSENELEDYFLGATYDWDLNPHDEIITIRARDVWQRFKTKIPRETVDVSGTKTTTPITYTAANIIDVMLDIIDRLEVPDRLIDRASFTAIRDASRSGADWQVTRTLTDPTDARTLLGELQVIARLFLTPLPDGRLTAYIYDPATPGKVVVDARQCTVRKIESGEKDLSTRQLVYYSLNPGASGGSPEDYAKAIVHVNAQAEEDWGQVIEREYFDRWGMSSNAASGLAAQSAEWYSTPLMRVTLQDVMPMHNRVNPGQAVLVDGLRIPCRKALWPGYSYRKKFLMMGKTINPNDGMTMKWDLMEMRHLAGFSRTTVAYLTDGTKVGAGRPRYEGVGTGQGCLVEEATTNLVAAGIATASDLSMFAVDSGCSLSLETAYPLAGSSSVKCVTPATAGRGVYFDFPDAPTISASTVYSGQVLLAGAGTVEVYLRSYTAGQAVVATSTAITVQLAATAQRICVDNFNSGASAALMQLVAQAKNAEACTIIADGYQIEQKTACSSWQDPAAGQRGRELLTVPSAGLLSPTAGTVVFRLLVTAATKRVLEAGTSHRLLHVPRSSAATDSGIYVGHNNSGFVAGTVDNSGAQTATSYASNASVPSGLHTVAVTWTATTLRFVVDGAQVGADVADPKLPAAFWPTVYLGCHPTDSKASINSIIDSVYFVDKEVSVQRLADFHRTGVFIPVDGETVKMLDFDDNLEIKQLTV